MIKDMDMCERDAVLAVADKMVTAAKTAPKASGQDSIVAAVGGSHERNRQKRRQGILHKGRRKCG